MVLAAATLWFVVQANYEFLLYAVTLLVFPVFKSIVAPGASRMVFAVLLVLAASSVGAVNEIIEFAAVVLFQADGVGGYHNTCIDLVANLLGAVVSTVYLAVVRAF